MSDPNGQPDAGRDHVSARAEQKRPITAKAQAFLAAFSKCGTVTHAAEATGVHPRAHYSWLEHNDTYREEFERARAAFVEMLEAEALRRAVKGVEEPVFHRGKICGTKLKFSDLLMFGLLRANAPAKWREKHEQGDESKAPPPKALVFFNLPAQPKNDDSRE